MRVGLGPIFGNRFHDLHTLRYTPSVNSKALPLLFAMRESWQ